MLGEAVVRVSKASEVIRDEGVKGDFIVIVQESRVCGVVRTCRAVVGV
jgi:hypothetical protein